MPSSLRTLVNFSLNSNFFSELLKVVHRAGLVGEDKNALAVYIAAVSRLMDKPINLFVKGSSGSGKNFLVKTILDLIPESEIQEITSSSGASWSYQGGKLKNKIIYLQEENTAAGNVHPARLLISENKLIRQVTARRGGQWITEQQITEGPVACISTTTKDRLEVDDESRHISLWVNESQGQTRQILRSIIDGNEGLRLDELCVLRGMQTFFRERANSRVLAPKWLKPVADQTNVDDLRARRYFQAFIDACKVVCLIRSFSRSQANASDELQMCFSDYAVTTLIMDTAFSNSLCQANDEQIETKRWVTELAREKKRPIRADDLAQHYQISASDAYSRLREAADVKLIRRANPTEKSNRKFYLPGTDHRFLPDPKTIFAQVAKSGDRLTFPHPITGERVVYEK